MMKSLILALKRLLGFPEPPKEHQVNEKYVTMREQRDCAVAAVANACGVSYEKAHKALWHWNLPFFLESPLLSNPANVCRAISSLGFKANDQITWTKLATGDFQPGRLIVLLHDPKNPLWAQHWVVVVHIVHDGFMCAWGDGDLRHVNTQDMLNYYVKGFPNCAIEVV